MSAPKSSRQAATPSRATSQLARSAPAAAAPRTTRAAPPRAAAAIDAPGAAAARAAATAARAARKAAAINATMRGAPTAARNAVARAAFASSASSTRDSHPSTLRVGEKNERSRRFVAPRAAVERPDGRCDKASGPHAEHVTRAEYTDGVERGVNISGTEHLAAVSFAGGSLSPMGSMVPSATGYLINPLTLGAIRLELLARVYAKFRPNRFRVRYVPDVTDYNAPANLFALAFNDDPDAPLPDPGTNGVNAMFTWGKNTVTNRYCDHFELDLHMMLNQQATLFMDSTDERRFDSCGRLIAVAVDGNASFPTGTMGHLFVDYDFDCYEPNVPNDLSPTIVMAAPALASGASGSVFISGMVFAGSTEVLTSIQNPQPTTPQFILNSPPGSDTNWMITYRAYVNTAAATITTYNDLFFTPQPLPASSLGGLSDFSSSDLLVSRSFQSINGFNKYASTATFPIVNNTVTTSIYMFSARGPTLLDFRAPVTSAGTTRCAITITKIEDDFIGRSRAHAPFITAKQAVCLDAILGDQSISVAILAKLVASYVSDVDAGTKHVTATDLHYLEALHHAIGSPLPTALATQPPTAAPLFLPLLAGAAAWLLAKVGPTIASGVLGYGVKKLTEYAAGKTEEPDRRETRRAKRSQRRREELEGEEQEPEV